MSLSLSENISLLHQEHDKGLCGCILFESPDIELEECGPSDAKEEEYLYHHRNEYEGDIRPMILKQTNILSNQQYTNQFVTNVNHAFVPLNQSRKVMSYVNLLFVIGFIIPMIVLFFIHVLLKQTNLRNDHQDNSQIITNIDIFIFVLPSSLLLTWILLTYECIIKKSNVCMDHVHQLCQSYTTTLQQQARTTTQPTNHPSKISFHVRDYFFRYPTKGGCACFFPQTMYILKYIQIYVVTTTATEEQMEAQQHAQQDDVLLLLGDTPTAANTTTRQPPPKRSPSQILSRYNDYNMVTKYITNVARIDFENRSSFHNASAFFHSLQRLTLSKVKPAILTEDLLPYKEWKDICFTLDTMIEPYNTINQLLNHIQALSFLIIVPPIPYFLLLFYIDTMDSDVITTTTSGTTTSSSEALVVYYLSISIILMIIITVLTVLVNYKRIYIFETEIFNYLSIHLNDQYKNKLNFSIQYDKIHSSKKHYCRPPQQRQQTRQQQQQDINNDEEEDFAIYEQPQPQFDSSNYFSIIYIQVKILEPPPTTMPPVPGSRVVRHPTTPVPRRVPPVRIPPTLSNPTLERNPAASTEEDNNNNPNNNDMDYDTYRNNNAETNANFTIV